jgi:hypothetical protein
MAQATKTHSARPEKRVDAKLRISPEPNASNRAAQTNLARSADDTCASHKKVGLAEALREEGINERTIAQGFASLHSKLSGSEDKGDLKLFFDVLKDNHRTLEPSIPSDRTGDAPVTIILRHNMARPARETKADPSDADRLSTSHASEGCSFAENN